MSETPTAINRDAYFVAMADRLLGAWDDDTQAGAVSMVEAMDCLRHLRNSWAPVGFIREFTRRMAFEIFESGNLREATTARLLEASARGALHGSVGAHARAQDWFELFFGQPSVRSCDVLRWKSELKGTING